MGRIFIWRRQFGRVALAGKLFDALAVIVDPALRLGWGRWRSADWGKVVGIWSLSKVLRHVEAQDLKVFKVQSLVLYSEVVWETAFGHGLAIRLEPSVCKRRTDENGKSAESAEAEPGPQGKGHLETRRRWPGLRLPRLRWLRLRLLRGWDEDGGGKLTAANLNDGLVKTGPPMCNSDFGACRARVRHCLSRGEAC